MSTKKTGSQYMVLSRGWVGRLPVYFILLVPSSLQYTPLIYKSGVYFVDVFCAFLYFIAILFSRKKSNAKFDLIFLCLLVPIFVVGIWSCFFWVSGDLETIESLKDYRPLIFMLDAIFFLMYIKRFSIIFNISKLAWFSVISCFIFSLISFLGYSNSHDLFYLDDEFRYNGIQTYFCLGYSLTYLYSEYLGRNRCLFLFCSISVVISLSKMLAFVVLLAVLGKLVILAFHRVRSLFVFFYSCFIYILCFCVLFFSILSLDNYTLLEGFIHRYSPALDLFDKMSQLEFIFGSGFGSLFYIPWFEYRENVNNFSVQIDVLYLTLYFKYGIISALIIFSQLTLFYLMSKRKTYLLGIFLPSCIALLFLSSSSYYHIAFFGLYVFFIVFWHQEDKSNFSGQDLKLVDEGGRSAA